MALALPAALREGYALLGGRPDLTSNQDTLPPPDELYVDDGALVFRVENQACAFWGVPLAELGRADPPTAMRPDLADKSAERWEPWLPTVSMSLVEVVLSESLAGEDGLSDHRDGEDADDALLAAHFTRLPVPAYPDRPAGAGQPLVVRPRPAGPRRRRLAVGAGPHPAGVGGAAGAAARRLDGGVKLTEGTDALLAAFDRVRVTELFDPARPSSV
ncbi:hypothetical protein [Micromonospora kangleipakensis]|uniref:hypothetical protein n=1 Tax=Micromonospora kangleipakensis TaxID=1077942 RepID=UPI001A91B185|nr:hypothetical protein [Micromonospora kangleipakensis]